MQENKRIGEVSNGFNLDHLKVGNALPIIKLLSLDKRGIETGVGINLTSSKLGFKDLLRVNGQELTPAELDKISIFALNSTYSVIRNSTVVSKKVVELADTIEEIIECPNFRCVSRQVKSKFNSVKRPGKTPVLRCHYCSNEFELNQIEKFNI